MKCLYCDEEITTTNLYSLFVERDPLCNKCREKLNYHHQKFKIDGIEVESFYNYDSLFKDLLLQYKECYDESLKDIFLYRIKNYLNIKYHDYKLIFIPSTKRKLEERGFNHLKEIFECLELDEATGLEMKEELCQAGLGITGRAKMSANYRYIGKGLKKALIVDDVITTGSSIKGAYLEMTKHADKIKVVVLAKT